MCIAKMRDEFKKNTESCDKLREAVTHLGESVGHIRKRNVELDGDLEDVENKLTVTKSPGI